MTGPQYKFALHMLGMTQADAAEFLEISLRTSHAYANGTADVPFAVSALLWLMVKFKLKPEDVR